MGLYVFKNMISVKIRLPCWTDGIGSSEQTDVLSRTARIHLCMEGSCCADMAGPRPWDINVLEGHATCWFVRSLTVHIIIVELIKVSNETYILELFKSQQRKIKEISHLQTKWNSRVACQTQRRRRMWLLQPSSVNTCFFYLRMAYFLHLKEELTLPLQTSTSLGK